MPVKSKKDAGTGNKGKQGRNRMAYNDQTSGKGGGLEERAKRKVRPIVDEAVHKSFGVTIDEMSRDISEKMERSPLLRFEVDTSIPLKKARKRFAKEYLKRLLEINYGNISEVARIADVDRRSVHRLVKETGISVDRIRKDMAKAYDIKQMAISSIIEDVLDDYRTVFHPEKLDRMYRSVSDVSREILDVLPERQPTLKEAEEEFEKEYIRKALAENDGNITRTARKAGLRYETLHRKMKKHGLHEGESRQS
ncbi:MAG: helix-turn-helix domain-containing protein [Candidatus Woesearchaeota archaeon]